MQEDFCMGYLIGVLDRLAWRREVCLPPGGPGTASSIAVGTKFLNDHPERWSVTPSLLLEEAYKNAFPCRGR